MAAGQILVAPATLIQTSGEFESTMGQVTSIVNNMMEIVDGLSSVWTGDAATAYTGKFHELQDDMTRIESMIKEHVSDLQEMAKNYQTAEEANEDLAKALEGDVIS